MSEKKYEEVALKISINTGAYASTDKERLLIEVDHTSYFLDAIFWFNHKILDLKSRLEMVSDFDDKHWQREFEQNSAFLSQIGNALSSQLTYYSLTIHKLAEQKETVLDLSNHPTPENGCLDLARKVSDYIRNPESPEEGKRWMFTHLEEMLGGIGKEDYLSSPELIQKFSACLSITNITQNHSTTF